MAATGITVATYEPWKYNFGSIGDLKQILYPNTSLYHPIIITNNSGAEKTIELAVSKNTESDDDWYKTIRFTEDPDDTIGSDTYVNELADEDSVVVYIFSKCTAIGWSQSYGNSSWSSSNLSSFDGALINNESTAANAALFGETGAAYITLDTSDALPEFVAVKLDLSAEHTGQYKVQYSDNGTAWSDASAVVDLTSSTTVAWWQWESVGPHRYWRLYKTSSDAETAYITELQFLKFIPVAGKDYGVYGSKKALIADGAATLDNIVVTANVGVAITQDQINDKHSGIGITGSRTYEFTKRLEQYGELVPLYYYPQAAEHPGSETEDYPYPPTDSDEVAYEWLVKAIVFPQKRNINYDNTPRLTLGMSIEGFQYEQRQIYFSPYGPAGMGWYKFAISSTDSHGYHPSPWFVVIDRVCYIVDDLRPVYAGGQLVAVHAAISTQNLMKFIIDPLLANKGFVITKIVDGDYPSDNPEFIDYFTLYSRDYDTKLYTGVQFTDFGIYH